MLEIGRIYFIEMLPPFQSISKIKHEKVPGLGWDVTAAGVVQSWTYFPHISNY
jgi:hypothetical protein